MVEKWGWVENYWGVGEKKSIGFGNQSIINIKTNRNGKEENVILAAKRKEKQKASVNNEKNPSDKSAN